MSRECNSIPWTAVLPRPGKGLSPGTGWQAQAGVCEAPAGHPQAASNDAAGKTEEGWPHLGHLPLEASPPSLVSQSGLQPGIKHRFSWRWWGGRVTKRCLIRRWKHTGKAGWLLGRFRRRPRVLLPRQVRREYKSDKSLAGLCLLHSNQKGCPLGWKGPPGRESTKAQYPQVESRRLFALSGNTKGTGRRHAAPPVQHQERDREMSSFLLKSGEIDELSG